MIVEYKETEGGLSPEEYKDQIERESAEALL